MSRSAGEPASRSPVQGSFLILVVAIGAAAAMVRVSACLNDFWLDEIWSWQTAQRLTSVWQIITGIHHDNNHYLNTLWMYLLGDQPNWVLYRVPSLVAGTVAVIAAGLAQSRRDRVAALTAMYLLGGSYLLIFYSSEARGYGPVMAFSLMAFLTAQRHLDDKRWSSAALFWLTSVLGFLSTLTFSLCYLGVLAWSAVRFARERRDWPRAVAAALRMHVVPAAFVVFLYVVDIRRLVIGGGAVLSTRTVLESTLALALGAPESGAWASLAGVTAVLLLATGLWVLWRDGSDLWVFFGVTIVVAPVLEALLWRSPVVFVRYWLVCILFFLLLTGELLARLYRRGPTGKAAFLALLTLFAAGNVRHTARLLRDGRGSYLAPLEYIVDHTRGSIITIGSDDDFRHPIILAFYARYLRNVTLRYSGHFEWPEKGTEWYLAHTLDQSLIPEPTLTDGQGNRYVLVKQYPYAGLSGWREFIYHNVSATASGDGGEQWRVDEGARAPDLTSCL